MKHLDLDKIRENDNSLPCSLSKLNIIECLSKELSNASTKFILDIGGGTVFYQTANIDEQLNLIIRLKKEYLAQVILLKANKGNLFERYTISTMKKGIVSAKSNKDYFNMAWVNWRKFEQPNWKKCSDATIDTTSLTVNDVVKEIHAHLRNNGV